MYSADPLSHGQGGSGILYKCKKCRRPLFAQSGVLAHPKGQGQFAFSWRSKLPSNKRLSSDEEEVDCKESLFLEPVKWMAQDILQTEGKLCCPKCNAKLGSFNWAGSRCSCGTWITPSFHVQPNKVDAKIQGLTPSNPLLHRPVSGLKNKSSNIEGAASNVSSTCDQSSACTGEKSLQSDPVNAEAKLTKDMKNVSLIDNDIETLKVDDLPPL